MSATTAAGELVKRALSDQDTAVQLQSDPDTAMSEYELTAEERAAFASGDEERIMRALDSDADYGIMTMVRVFDEADVE